VSSEDIQPSAFVLITFASLCIFNTCTATSSAFAAETDFTGKWLIDLRSTAERERNAECGTASFELIQSGEKISGNHTFATSDCGRINEGGTDSVKGIVVGATAILVVTSGRNGAIVVGKATTNGNFLLWQTLEEIKRGQPEGDSPLILEKGRLTRE